MLWHFKGTIIVKVVGELLFLYGLFAWVYGLVIQFVYPQWLSLPLSHLLPWIRTDTFTILSFIVSGLGFFMWRLATEISKLDKDKSTQ